MEYSSYSESLNSVIYFALLPYKLSDKAVKVSYKQDVSILGKDYFEIEVTFDVEGGGKDHDDKFYYWVDKERNTVYRFV